MTEVPRVDLEISQGNRGYIIGAPSETAELKTTRQMVHTTMEVPSFYKPKRGGPPAGAESLTPPETDLAVDEGASSSEAPARYDTYVVQKGDSLWSIAAKPAVYGTATKWRRLYDANRDLLKSPERIRPGMVLKIPRDDDEESQDIGTYTK